MKPSEARNRPSMAVTQESQLPTIAQGYCMELSIPDRISADHAGEGHCLSVLSCLRAASANNGNEHNKLALTLR